MGLLKEISGLCQENEDLRKKGMQADLAEVTRVKNLISKLSSSFYSLVPFKE
jgi:hypothetical protein